MPVQDDWDGYEGFAEKYLDPNTEVQRMMRAYPVYPMTGIPKEWIDRSDPNYQESIFQGQIGGIDPLGATSALGRFPGPRQTGWWSALKKALQKPQLMQAKKMKGMTLLNKLKQMGVSNEELRWTKIQELAERAGQEPVDMAIIRDLSEVHGIRLKDVNLGERKVPQRLYDLQNKYRKMRDEAGSFLHNLREKTREEAFYSTPEEFAEYMRKQPLRLDNIDVELAKELGISRMEKGKRKVERFIRMQKQYHEAEQMINQLDRIRYRMGKQTKPRHMSYVEDKPLPQDPDNFYNFLVRLMHPGDKVPGGAHYKFDNVVVGVIASTRDTMEGLKGLHIEEYQSDWSKDIRRYGVKVDRPFHIEQEYQQLRERREANNAAYWAQQDKVDQYRALYKDNQDKYGHHHDKSQEMRTKYLDALNKSSELYQEGRQITERLSEIQNEYPTKTGKPDMPFKDSEALKLGLKKALWEAARQGKDVLTWTRGVDLHKMRVGDNPAQKWPYTVYDEFTPKTLKSILNELGIKVEPKEMKYPGNMKFSTGHQENYEQLRQRYDELTDVIDDIEYDAAMEDLDPASHPDWENLMQERRDIAEQIEKQQTIKKEDVGFDVWGIELSPKDRQKILEKGFKMSKLNQIAKEMMA